MKINRVKGTDDNKMSWKDNLFMNIYHFLFNLHYPVWV